MRRLLGIAVLAVLGLGTPSLVESLIANPAAPATPHAADVRPHIVIPEGPHVRSVEVPQGTMERARREPPFKPGPMTRGARNIRLELACAGRDEILIAAHANLYERDDPVCFMWHVSVIDEARQEVVFEWNDAENVFWVYPGKISKLDFLGIVPASLETGEYLLELTAVDLHEEWDTSNLYAARLPLTIE
jgi:hypothetical protein